MPSFVDWIQIEPCQVDHVFLLLQGYFDWPIVLPDLHQYTWSLATNVFVDDQGDALLIVGPDDPIQAIHHAFA